jgi:hypothetical protein
MYGGLGVPQKSGMGEVSRTERWLDAAARTAFMCRRRRVTDRPRWGDDPNPVTQERWWMQAEQDGRRNVAQARTYEATFAGQAGSTLRAEFDDCEVIVGSDTTTLRADLPDQPALTGLILRITGLGLEVLDVHRVVPSPANE